MAKKKGKSVAFVKWFEPLLDALRDLGYSGKPDEVAAKIAENCKLDDEVLNETLKSGIPRFPNQVAWARQYLIWEGLLDSSKRGTWTLTEKGKNTHLTEEQAHEIFYKWSEFHRKNKQKEQVDPDETSVKEAVVCEYSLRLLDVLKKLLPKGFENVCKELLREHGFENLTVTKQSYDGGIDGYGTLEINPFVNVRMIFQCKRYDKSVPIDHVRSFIGTMHTNRFSYGIFLTTGTFTSETYKEVERAGDLALELVDGERLVEMFEKVELGVKPKTVYEVDPSYFEKFKD